MKGPDEVTTTPNSLSVVRRMVVTSSVPSWRTRSKAAPEGTACKELGWLIENRLVGQIYPNELPKRRRNELRHVEPEQVD
jgi:hypothetical protein